MRGGDLSFKDLNGPEIHQQTNDILSVACSLNVQSGVCRAREIMPPVIEGEIAPIRFLGHWRNVVPLPAKRTWRHGVARYL